MKAKILGKQHAIKILLLFLLAVAPAVLLTVFPGKASCLEEPMEIGTTVFALGIDEAAVEVSIVGSGAFPAAGKLELTYSPEAITVKEILPGDRLKNVPLFASKIMEPGIVRVSWADPLADGEKNAEGSLLRIIFKREKEQLPILNFSQVELIRADGSTVSFRVNGGKLETGGAACCANEIVLQIDREKAWVDGYPVVFSAAPFLSGGCTMVPVRFIGEHFGVEVAWLPEKDQVRIEGGHKTVLLTINSSSALVNGVKVKLDFPAIIKGGIAYVPLRFVSTILNADIIWDGVEQKITITRF
ncbi:MAG TPA: hypothetical protein GXZ24_02540 [Firmicutes bacterium]|nr:hypothetical protein [Bacillota bacterium]